MRATEPTLYTFDSSDEFITLIKSNRTEGYLRK